MPTCLYVSPAFTGHDTADSRWVNSKHARQFGLANIVFVLIANAFDRFWRQARLGQSRAAGLTPLSHFISGIVGTCSKKQVIWVHAMWHVASVKNAEVGRDRADKSFVGQTVSEFLTAIDAKRTIPARCGAEPDPAVWTFIDTITKTCHRIARGPHRERVIIRQFTP